MPKTSKTSRGKKKQIITIVVVVLLLALAAGAGVLLQWLQHRSTNGSKGTVTTSGIPGSNDGSQNALTQNNLPQSVKDAQGTAAQSDYDQSNKQIAASLATSRSNDEKFELYIQQAVNYENQQKWDDALNSYKQAESLKQTSGLYESMGRVAEAKGDKTAALGYYKKAVPLVPTADPLHDFYVNQLQSKITGLGG